MTRDLRAGVGGFAPQTAGQAGRAGTSARPGMNDRLPCGTDAARRRHLARGQECDTCRTSPWTTGVDQAQRDEAEVRHHAS
jgi:hypothetical protein